MCNDTRFDNLDPHAIHKRYRICRRHFDSDCLNGGCRRLLNTAVPTLHLNQSPMKKNLNNIVTETLESDNEFLLAPKEEITFVSMTTNSVADEIEEHFEIIPTNKPQPMSVPIIECTFTESNTMIYH